MYFRSDWLTNIQSMQQQMEQLLDQFTRRKPPAVRFSSRAWEPAIDVYETPDQVVVLAELAGVLQEDIAVSIHGRRMLISAHRRDERSGGDRTYHQMEIATGAFQRTVALPAEVDVDRAAATCCDGMLEIVMPKRVGGERKIDIRPGLSGERRE